MSKGFKTFSPCLGELKKYISYYYFHWDTEQEQSTSFYFYPHYKNALTIYKDSKTIKKSEYSVLTTPKKNHIQLFFNCYLFLINFSGFYLGYIYNSIILSLLLVTFFGCLGYLGLLFYSLKEMKKVSFK